jgi:hypothetical protein
MCNRHFVAGPYRLAAIAASPLMKHDGLPVVTFP